MTQQKDEVMSLRLSANDKKKLLWLANQTTGNMSTTLRLLISNTYRLMNNKKSLPMDS